MLATVMIVLIISAFPQMKNWSESAISMAKKLIWLQQIIETQVMYLNPQ